MITFKQFLTEGGAATADFGTVRATKKDMEAALRFINRVTRIPVSELQDSLLGSTPHTLSGKKPDSGDMDIAFEEGAHDRDVLVAEMKEACGMEDVKNIGGNTFSFAVPTYDDRKIQVDFMFVPSREWAKFGYHSAADSAHKGAVRNALLDALITRIYEKDKDVSVKDEKGIEMARARRSFKREGGLERLFKVAPMRKDGKGRVQLRKGTADEMEALLKQAGKTVKFSKESDPIMNPDKAAAFLFGPGVKAKQLLRTEDIIPLIMKRPDHSTIFKHAVADIKSKNLPVPAEIQEFV